MQQLSVADICLGARLFFNVWRFCLLFTVLWKHCEINL